MRPGRVVAGTILPHCHRFPGADAYALVYMHLDEINALLLRATHEVLIPCDIMWYAVFNRARVGAFWASIRGLHMQMDGWCWLCCGSWL